MTVEPSAQPRDDDAPGDDKQAIMEDIERTREQLGETVEALAAKADVRARAEQKTAEVKARAGQKAAEVTGTIKAKVGGPVKDQVERARQTGGTVWEATPEPVQRQTRKVAAVVSQHRGKAVAVAATLLAGWLTIRKLRRR
jgi:Protein of unknown function (DUF3618)